MITEMNAQPSPQWLKDFQKEIEEEYKIPHTDAIFIAGKVAKMVRKRDKKACEWLSERCAFGVHPCSGTALVMEFRKVMEE